MAKMTCPTCRVRFDPEQSRAVPFCSERCREIDLARWLDERYSVPVAPDPEADEEPPGNGREVSDEE